MMVIFPSNFFASSSTEGASALHVLQVGAQNQKAAFLPTRLEPSNVPPPTSGLENASVGGITTGLAGAGAAVVATAALAAAVVTGALVAAADAAGLVVVAAVTVVVTSAAGAAGVAEPAGRVDVVDAPHALRAMPVRAKTAAVERQRREEARSEAVRVMGAV
jgi:hypothetical protein